MFPDFGTKGGDNMRGLIDEILISKLLYFDKRCNMGQD